MATVADLERLEALIGALQPLGAVRPGEPLNAVAWNTLVAAIIELARSVVTRERDTTVPLHSHEEQVSLAWLDSRLRSLVQNGPLSDPANVRTVIELQRRVGQLADTAREAQVSVGEVRTRLSEVATRDLVRQSVLTTVGRTVESLADGRDDVTRLRRTLDTIKSDLSTVTEAAQKFSANGAIVDLEGMQQRLSALEKVRERLTTPAGDLLDAMALEKRFAELSNSFVDEDELREALKGRLPDAIIPDLSRIRKELFEAIEKEVGQQSVAGMEKILREVRESIPDVNKLVAQGIDDRFAELAGQQLDKIAAQIPALIDQQLARSWQEAVSKQVAVVLKEAEAGFVRQVRDQVVSQLKLEYAKPVLDDDFMAIKGIGAAYNERLNQAGVYSYDDLAKLSVDQLSRILGLNTSTIMKQEILEQARSLATRHG